MGCVPIQLYLWILKFEFQITVLGHIFLCFPHLKTLKHAVGWIWPGDSNPLDDRTGYAPAGPTLEILCLPHPSTTALKPVPCAPATPEFSLLLRTRARQATGPLLMFFSLSGMFFSSFLLSSLLHSPAQMLTLYDYLPYFPPLLAKEIVLALKSYSTFVTYHISALHESISPP